MSLLRKLFGGVSAEHDAAAAETLLAEGDPGSAKLRFERALSKIPKAEAQMRRTLEERIAYCCDEIARQRQREAQELLSTGEFDLAEDELRGALEVAVNEALRQELRDLLDGSDRDQLVASAGKATSPLPTPDNLYAAMRSAEPTEEDQAIEYDSYGAPFEEALQATFRSDAAHAIELFEKLLGKAKDPRYLHYELALAYRLAERTEEAEAQFRTFLSRIAADEGGIARIQTHQALATEMLSNDDADGAIEEMQKAVEALPDSPTAYHELGNILRRCGYPVEAVEVLRAALDLDGGDHWMMRQALGLALIDAGHSKAARLELEQVVSIFVEREDLHLPVEASEALAQLFEADEEYVKAADLYRLLCEGASGDRAATFHLRAGQLLSKAGKADAASMMLKRAKALADEYELPEIADVVREAQATLASD